MFNKFFRNFLEPERLSWPIAHFYNFLPARMLQPTYRRIVEDLSIDNKGLLIDIGTGPGDLAKLIAQKYPGLKVIGIDSSEAMIRIAKKKTENQPNLEFRVMNGKNLKFPDNSIDYIVSTFTFHHWKDPLKIFNEIYRVLKPRGSAFIYDGYSDAADTDIDKGINNPFKIKIPRVFIRKAFSLHSFSKKEYNNYVKPLIERSNFKEIIFQPDKIYMKIKLIKP